MPNRTAAWAIANIGSPHSGHVVCWTDGVWRMTNRRLVIDNSSNFRLISILLFVGYEIEFMIYGEISLEFFWIYFGFLGEYG